MKIIAVSDTHGRNEVLKELEDMYPDASLFLHTGDFGRDHAGYDHWICVRGNNDPFHEDIPLSRVVLAEGHRILMLHGHQYAPGKRLEQAAKKAKEENCSIVLLGHSHKSGIWQQDGVLIVNPGSLWRNRDGKLPSYAVLEIEKDKEKAYIKHL